MPGDGGGAGRGARRRGGGAAALAPPPARASLRPRPPAELRTRRRPAASAPARLEAGLRVPPGLLSGRSCPGAGEPSGLEEGVRQDPRQKQARWGRPPCPPRRRKMVFESVVVDVLNRFLGDYVVNLDTSQLTLGIWGGNETVAGPQSCLPPGLPLRERGPTLLGPRAPGWPDVATCHRPPGSNYVKPGDSSRPSPARCLFLAGGAGGVGAGGGKALFFRAAWPGVP